MIILKVENEVLGHNLDSSDIDKLTMNINKKVTIEIQRDLENLTFSYNPNNEGFEQALSRVTRMIEDKGNVLAQRVLENTIVH